MASFATRTTQKFVLPPAVARVLLWIYEYMSLISACILFSFLLYVSLWWLTEHDFWPPGCTTYTFRYYYDDGDKFYDCHVDEPGYLPLESLPKPRVAVCESSKYFNVFIFYAFALFFGHLTEILRLPGLVGMLLTGLALHYISFSHPYFRFLRLPMVEDSGWHYIEDTKYKSSLNYTPFFHVDKNISSILRQSALASFLIKDCLRFDPSVLSQAADLVSRIAVIPCLSEALSTMVTSKFLLNWSWPWAAMLGFVLAAISPDIVVPNMMRLEESGWGVRQGIPTITMAACIIDEVVTIMGFGVMFSFAHSNTTDPNALRPLDSMLTTIRWAGIGLSLGVLLWFLPHPNVKHATFIRCFLFFIPPVTFIGRSLFINVPLAGVLGCIIFILSAIFGLQRGWPWCMVWNRDQMLHSAAPQQSDDLANRVGTTKDMPNFWALHLSQDEDYVIQLSATGTDSCDDSFLILAVVAIILRILLTNSLFTSMLICILFLLLFAIALGRGWLSPSAMRLTPQGQNGVARAAAATNNAQRGCDTCLLVAATLILWRIFLVSSPYTVLLTGILFILLIAIASRRGWLGGGWNRILSSFSARQQSDGSTRGSALADRMADGGPDGFWPLRLLRNLIQTLQSAARRFSAKFASVTNRYQQSMADGAASSSHRSEIKNSSTVSAGGGGSGGSGAGSGGGSGAGSGGGSGAGSGGGGGSSTVQAASSQDQMTPQAGASSQGTDVKSGGTSASKENVTNQDETAVTSRFDAKAAAASRPDPKAAKEEKEYQDPGRSRLRRVQGSDMTERHLSLEPDENNSGRQTSNSSLAAWVYFTDESEANNYNVGGSSRAGSASFVIPTASPVAREQGMDCIKTIRYVMDAIWFFMQPLLFAIIGEAVPLTTTRYPYYRRAIGLGVAVIFCGVVIRFVATFYANTSTKLTERERIFVAIAWMPKATVQAATGGLILDLFRLTSEAHKIDWGVGHNSTFHALYERSQQICILAIISILITAPLGAILMQLTAPYLLTQDGGSAPRSKLR